MNDEVNLFLSSVAQGKEREDRADRLLNTASENANWAVHVLRSQRDPLEVWMVLFFLHLLIY